MLDHILFIIALVWIIDRAQHMLQTYRALPAANKMRNMWLNLRTCSTCYSFWLGLVLTLDPIAASLASLTVSVLFIYLQR